MDYEAAHPKPNIQNSTKLSHDLVFLVILHIWLINHNHTRGNSSYGTCSRKFFLHGNDEARSQLFIKGWVNKIRKGVQILTKLSQLSNSFHHFPLLSPPKTHIPNHILSTAAESHIVDGSRLTSDPMRK